MSVDHSESAAPPQVFNADIDSVPLVEIGTDVRAYRIDPSTGQRTDESEGFFGTAWHGEGAPEGGVHKGHCLYVLPPGKDEKSPSHTSGIDRIDSMCDGSYWLYTLSKNKSVYRLEIVQPPIAPAEQVGLLRKVWRGTFGKLL
ncbi:hypothetical protein COU76_01010 [Candidatus Peregrinibacteria bacterium CG10_big_fil_rev_8_21_14_0_10_49_10]|nr:MAG: hypothetical protein COU76_01010 [Candidatus Peregrinibacteria bacterium CG10_big_fil_rev_8_21_14_0_10_49_10]